MNRASYDKARTAVFLPGTMCDQRLFAEQIMQAAANGWKIRVPYLAGYSNIEQLASVLLDRLPERFAAIGLSFGSLVALEMHRQQPQRISHIALMSTHPDTYGPEQLAKRRTSLEHAKQMGLEIYMREVMMPLYLHKQAASETVVAMALDTGFGIWSDQLEMICTRKSYIDDLASISVPALVACGSHDQVCPPAAHEQAAGLMQQAQLEQLDQCAHLITLEKPDDTAGMIVQLLNRN